MDKLTNGRMKITPLPAGTVGNIFKLHEAVEDGLVVTLILVFTWPQFATWLPRLLVPGIE